MRQAHGEVQYSRVVGGSNTNDQQTNLAGTSQLTYNYIVIIMCMTESLTNTLVGPSLHLKHHTLATMSSVSRSAALLWDKGWQGLSVRFHPDNNNGS